MTQLVGISLFFRPLYLGILFVTAVKPSSGADWSYDDHHGDTGPSNWKKYYPACGGASQSPIDLVQSNAEYRVIPAINFQGYSDVDINGYTVVNNGHTVQLNVPGDGTTLTIRDGGLPGTYRLAQFHVHWGGSNRFGSEHTVDGKSYPLEIHFVHFSTRFTTIVDALRDPQGLAVIGVFAEVGEKHNTLDDIVSMFCSVKYKGLNTTGTKSFRMMSLLPTDTTQFFRYSGSLTTPQCQESVVWTVLKNTIKISQTQLNAFRALSHGSSIDEDTPLQDNFRPVQKVGSRSVQRTFAVEAKPTSKPKSTGSKNFDRYRNGVASMAISVLLLSFFCSSQPTA